MCGTPASGMRSTCNRFGVVNASPIRSILSGSRQFAGNRWKRAPGWQALHSTGILQAGMATVRRRSSAMEQAFHCGIMSRRGREGKHTMKLPPGRASTGCSMCGHRGCAHKIIPTATGVTGIAVRAHVGSRRGYRGGPGDRGAQAVETWGIVERSRTCHITSVVPRNIRRRVC